MEFNKLLFELVENNELVYYSIWDKFKQINPDTKIRMVDYHEILYSLRVEWYSEPISVCKCGLKAALWRSLGNLFRRKSWIEKGIAIIVPPWNIRYVHLEPVHYADHLLDTVFSGYFGYAPEIDTLFMYNRVTAGGD